MKKIITAIFLILSISACQHPGKFFGDMLQGVGQGLQKAGQNGHSMVCMTAPGGTYCDGH